MTTLATDTFTRTDQSGWGTASDGETWTKNGSGTENIATNEGTLVSNGSDTNMQLGSNTALNVMVLCRIATGATGDYDGVNVRFSTAGGTNCYKLVTDGGTAGTHVLLNKQVAGAVTNLASAAFTFTAGTFYWFRLRSLGSVLYGRVWADGGTEPATWTLTASDTSLTSAGGVGLLASTGATAAKYDNFTASVGVGLHINDGSGGVFS